jgi:kynurenine 3-monooxygenase
MEEFSPPNTFSYTQRKLLPGCFKTARAESMPPLIDPESVSLILPKSSSITAFVEPTVNGGSCILFAGKLSEDKTTTTVSGSDNKDKDIGSLLFPHPDSYKKGEPPQQLDIDTLSNLIIEQFPLLEGTKSIDDLAKQLLLQRTSVASSIKCNTYSSSSGTPVAIVGDAGHATGGVSGQGCNSALMDAVTLSDCLETEYKPPTEFIYNTQNAKRDLLHKGISSYSQKAVPEGHALYDLSFGNDGKTLPIFRNIKSLLSTGIDAVFGGRFGIGKKPLQTLLASSLTSFVDIRRDREKYFVEDFPSDESFCQELNRLSSLQSSKEKI